MTDHYALHSRDASVTVDLAIGHLVALSLPDGRGQAIAPLHRAPWADDPSTGMDLAPGIRGLSGDFLCAPFGQSDVDGSPPHGWPANSSWRLVSETHEAGIHSATFELGRDVLGARLQKHLRLRDGEQFLYQSHVFIGGQGAVSVAHHPMMRLADGGRLSHSAKAYAETPQEWPEGASVLAYPARSVNLAHFPGSNGRTIDLTRLPLAETNEDFVMLVEAPGNELGWTAVSRRAERDTVLVLKNPAQLPITMLWTSNGGREAPPWNGHHRGVVGVEDRVSFSLHGHRASVAANPLSAAGVPTAITLVPDGQVEIRHVIGAYRNTAGAPSVTSLTPGIDALKLVIEDGGSVDLAFDVSFLASTH